MGVRGARRPHASPGDPGGEARARGDTFIEARSLNTLAQYDLEAGEVEPAIPLLEEAYQIQRNPLGVPDRYWFVILVCRFARALALKGEAGATIQLLACADARFEELEVNEGNAERWVARMNDETREMVGPSIDAAAAARASEEGRKLTVDEAVEVAVRLLR